MNRGFTHTDQARWDRLVHFCPFVAEMEQGHVPPIMLALAPSVALDRGNGRTRFRFARRSDRDKFLAAWRSIDVPCVGGIGRPLR